MKLHILASLLSILNGINAHAAQRFDCSSGPLHAHPDQLTVEIKNAMANNCGNPNETMETSGYLEFSFFDGQNIKYSDSSIVCAHASDVGFWDGTAEVRKLRAHYQDILKNAKNTCTYVEITCDFSFNSEQSLKPTLLPIPGCVPSLNVLR